MADTEPRFPFSDIPGDIAETIALCAQHADTFEELHTLAEQYRFNRIIHAASVIATKAVYERTVLSEYFMTGVQIYEVASAASSPDIAESETGLAVTLENFRRFLDTSNLTDFHFRGETQALTLQDEHPLLSECVHEITGRLYNDDFEAKRFATIGAGMMHGIHKRTVRLVG